MNEQLIILGAGATAAISDGALPVGENFFSSNSTWSSNMSDYPHLAIATRKVESLKDTTSASLTDVWLFLDTVFKYHCATRLNSTYDYNLLRIRYEKMNKDDLPCYLRADYLNTHYQALCSDMRPCFSTLRKRIYDTYPQTDPVAYFLVIAGWELKHLQYKTYHPEISSGDLYAGLLKSLKSKVGEVAVISFNYDIFFEMSCRKQGALLELLPDSDNVQDQVAIPFCKPHGGWNIRHLNSRIEPYRSLADFVQDQNFDGLPDDEERPAMIPYFSHPDEISDPHDSRYPGVGEFFRKQEKRMRTLLENARAIVSIGYSFSDVHVKEIVQGISSGQIGRGKRVLCVSKGEKEKTDVMLLWNFEKEGRDTFKYRPCGFDEAAIGEIVDFFNTGKS